MNRLVEGAVRVLRDSIYPEADEPGHRRFVLVQLVRLLIVVWRQLVRDRCTQQAASLAYQSALSLVPILVVAFASLRALRVFDSDVETLTWLGGSFVPSASQSVAQSLASLLRKTDLAALGIAPRETQMGRYVNSGPLRLGAKEGNPGHLSPFMLPKLLSGSHGFLAGSWTPSWNLIVTARLLRWPAPFAGIV